MKRRDFLKGTTLGVAATATMAAGNAADTPREIPAVKLARVLCWSELTEPKEVYPKGINGAIAEYLKTQPGMSVRTASINDPDQGLSDQALDETDALIFWGHNKHREIQFDRVAAILKRVKAGKLGVIALHSTLHSKVFMALLDTTGDFGGWRHDAGAQSLRVVAPSHPIAKGIGDFTVPETEMYNEPFQVPPPEKVIFFSYWATGEQFRSGMVWTVGKGRVFYFQPGHETHNIYYQPIPRKVIANAVLWCAQRT